MALVESVQPTILLLGGGYTLQKVAGLLPKGSFVITSREPLRCEVWRAMGWCAEATSLEDFEGVQGIFLRYPGIEVVVDSVPPLRSGDAAQGPKMVTHAMENSTVRRIIYLSTTGVFGVRDGSHVDETTPPAPWNPQGAARLACEEVYRAWAQQRPGVRSTALRLPAIYGADRGVAFSIRQGTYRWIDQGEQWTNRIHVDDLARVIVACIQHSSDLPSVLCVSDDCPSQARDVAAYICQREGLPLPGSISSQEALQRGAYTMLSNQRVSNARMKATLNITLRYPSFREGIYGVGEASG